MRIASFPGCCCASIAYEFVESDTAGGWSGDEPNDADHAKRWLRDKVRGHRAMGYSQIVIITNNEQRKINRALMEMMEENETPNNHLSIIYTPWMASRKHSTFVRTWVLQLQAEPSADSLCYAGVNNE